MKTAEFARKLTNSREREDQLSFRPVWGEQQVDSLVYDAGRLLVGKLAPENAVNFILVVLL